MIDDGYSAHKKPRASRLHRSHLDLAVILTFQSRNIGETAKITS